MRKQYGGTGTGLHAALAHSSDPMTPPIPPAEEDEVEEVYPGYAEPREAEPRRRHSGGRAHDRGSKGEGVAGEGMEFRRWRNEKPVSGRVVFKTST